MYGPGMDVYLMDRDNVRDLTPEVMENGRLKVLPAEYWAGTTRQERALFGVTHGLYGFPTVELVEWLGNLIDGRRAIEICAGHGVLAEALGIPGTDSHQQLIPKYRVVYELAGQAIVPYGPNVEKINARDAVRKYKPDVVIGSWVTHKYDHKRPFAGGNEVGVDQKPILRRVKTYVHIGNDKVHQHDPMWDLPHEKRNADWLYSRSMNGSPDFVAVWNKTR